MYYQTTLIIGGGIEREEYIVNLAQEYLGTANYKNHPDYFEVLEEEKLSIGIEAITYLQGRIQYKPYQSNTKLVAIKDAEKLTIEAQNCLLKTLEESPSDTHIVLSSNSHHSFLPTILSRCNVVELNDDSATVSLLEDFTVESFLKQSLIEKYKFISDIASIKPSVKQKATATFFLKELTKKYREKMLESSNYGDREKAKVMLKLIDQTYRNIQSNSNLKLALENLIIRL